MLKKHCIVCNTLLSVIYTSNYCYLLPTVHVPRVHVCNQTKSNQNLIEPNWTAIVLLTLEIKQKYRTSILLWVGSSIQSNKTKHNLTQFDSIIKKKLFGIHLLTSKSWRSNHNQPLLNGINRKTLNDETERKCSVSIMYIHTKQQ